MMCKLKPHIAMTFRSPLDYLFLIAHIVWVIALLREKSILWRWSSQYAFFLFADFLCVTYSHSLY